MFLASSKVEDAIIGSVISLIPGENKLYTKTTTNYFESTFTLPELTKATEIKPDTNLIRKCVLNLAQSGIKIEQTATFIHPQGQLLIYAGKNDGKIHIFNTKEKL